MARFLNASLDKPKTFVKTANNNPSPEKVAINPKVMNIGRVLLVCPVDAPSKIGNKGKIHGAPIVNMPAKIATKICNIYFIMKKLIVTIS